MVVSLESSPSQNRVTARFTTALTLTKDNHLRTSIRGVVEKRRSAALHAGWVPGWLGGWPPREVCRVGDCMVGEGAAIFDTGKLKKKKKHPQTSST